MLGTYATPGMILTAQTAGESLNFHPHLHGLIANGAWDGLGAFIQFHIIDIAEINKHFSELVLSALHKKELVTDSTVMQMLSQKHSGLSVWFGEPFQDSERNHFLACYIERGPLSLEKLSISGLLQAQVI